MNFEFLRNIKGMNKLYKHCKNAEDLALSKPEYSMIASRKSGEALARFIYLTVYKDAAEHLSFAELLADYKVKRYIDNHDVLDAFHNIRKKGNIAAHENEDPVTEDALELLEDLHYIVGETAYRQRLIDDYPEFDSDIDKNPDAEFIRFDSEAVALNMVIEGIDRYKVSKLMDKFSELMLPFKFGHSDIDLTECVELKNKAVLSSTIPQIQSYFGYLALEALKRQFEEKDGEDDSEIRYEATITLYGEQEKTTSDLVEFMYCLLYDLPEADGFKIESSYYGPGFAGKVDDEILVPFYRTCNFDKTEEGKNINYKCFEFLGVSGETSCEKFENGKWVDLNAQMNPEILDKGEPNTLWWNWGSELIVEFDYDKYSQIREALLNAVRKHLPEDMVELVEKDSKYEDIALLIVDCQWGVEKLRTIQNFLDEINQIIEPIKDECECSAEGEWYLPCGVDGVATWKWTEDGFKIVGTEL
ncbi:MAG: DUF4145 domain-containing protein [Acutalibacteraceae bacterium]|nr:DUF4145 domain-containing protein [Acutalibacteraceae bacterium]